MAQRFKIADTPTELERLFRLRHQIFVEEVGYFPPRCDRRFHDVYDASPSTVNLIALVDGNVVGGVRLTRDSPTGSAADPYFDFGPFLPEDQTGGASVSILCVAPNYRHRGVYATLMGMLLTWCEINGIGYLKSVANPVVFPLLHKMGWTPVAPEFFHVEYRLRCLPLMLVLDEIKPPFADFVRRHRQVPLQPYFIRQVHTAGETILEDEAETEEYQIVSGSVTMTLRTGTQSSVSLGPGEMLGNFIRAYEEEDVVFTAENRVELAVINAYSLATLSSPEDRGGRGRRESALPVFTTCYGG